MIFADRDYGGRARVGTHVTNLRGSCRDRISSLRVF